MTPMDHKPKLILVYAGCKTVRHGPFRRCEGVGFARFCFSDAEYYAAQKAAVEEGFLISYAISFDYSDEAAKSLAAIVASSHSTW